MRWFVLLLLATRALAAPGCPCGNAKNVPLLCPTGQAARGVDQTGWNAAGCFTPTGAPGPQGPQGLTGPAGPQGPAGVCPVCPSSGTFNGGPVQNPIQIAPLPARPFGQVQTGADRLMGTKLRVVVEDNDFGSIAITGHDCVDGGGNPTPCTGWFSSAFVGMAYNGIAGLNLHDQGDEPTLVSLGPTIINPPVFAPTMTFIPCPSGQTCGFFQGWIWSVAAEKWESTYGGATSVGPRAYAQCTSPTCALMVSYPHPEEFAQPWYGGGTVELVLTLGDGGKPGLTGTSRDLSVNYAWKLDRLFSATDSVTELDSNGELETEVQFNLSGPHIVEFRDPIAGWATPWAAGKTVGVRDSVLEPPLNAQFPSVRWRDIIDGVHCDAACQHCAGYRGATSSFGSTPPPWPTSFKGSCDTNGNRVRRQALVGVGMHLAAPHGTCPLLVDQYPGGPPDFAHSVCVP